MKNTWPNFDELKHLAKHSPEQLEQLRSDEIERVIARAAEPTKKRLRGLQFQIDCQRRLHKTPLGSCIAISNMMRESLQQLNSALHGDFETAIRVKKPSRNTNTGKVIPFTNSFAG